MAAAAAAFGGGAGGVSSTAALDRSLALASAAVRAWKFSGHNSTARSGRTAANRGATPALRYGSTATNGLSVREEAALGQEVQLSEHLEQLQEPLLRRRLEAAPHAQLPVLDAAVDARPEDGGAERGAPLLALLQVQEGHQPPHKEYTVVALRFRRL